MTSDDMRAEFREDGFVILPGYLSAGELAPAVGELGTMFPSPEGYHERTDPRWERFPGDEFAGIDQFPFTSAELSLLAVHDRLVDLARDLLDDDDLRIYGAESWAKFTGANDYDQELHRDYLNHTLMVPGESTAREQVEFFVYLADVPEELGPPHLLSTRHTRDLSARPNWYPRDGGHCDPGGYVAPQGSPELYAAEV
ncbi:phytanoyl-CoA dioxygenase family protein, partial [Kitasatospora putterlickiae]|uniref:phytanoyl-CoA dioxygenase family protein n=1 Tax=Kitasatospora putterlickiae TaxID=221725 RepID=UPI0031D0DA85